MGAADGLAAARAARKHLDASGHPPLLWAVVPEAPPAASEGVDDVEFLCEMGDDKIDTILTEAGMAKVGHRKRFVHLVQKLRAAAA